MMVVKIVWLPFFFSLRRIDIPSLSGSDNSYYFGKPTRAGTTVTTTTLTIFIKRE